MGCDIHTYVEFAKRRDDGRKPYWQNFTRNGGSRDYVMFGVLAGLRVPEVQLFEPSGMPDDGLGYYTSGDYWLSVAPDAHPEWADGDDWVLLERAERWVANGASVGERDDSGRLRRVSGPDWHSHSWLTADQLSVALDHYAEKITDLYPQEPGIPAEWTAMLAAMRSFEASGMLTRLVFWFDN